MDDLKHWRQCKLKLLRTKLKIKDAEARLVFAKLLLQQLRREAGLTQSRSAA